MLRLATVAVAVEHLNSERAFAAQLAVGCNLQPTVFPCSVRVEALSAVLPDSIKFN